MAFELAPLQATITTSGFSTVSSNDSNSASSALTSSWSALNSSYSYDNFTNPDTFGEQVKMQLNVMAAYRYGVAKRPCVTPTHHHPYFPSVSLPTSQAAKV